MDSIASIMSILLDVFFGRLFLYVSPLCPIVGPYFWYPSMILKIYYYVLVHTRFAKAVAQIFMVLNRMTCVLVPTFYTTIWNKLIPISVAMILLVPFGGTWYLLLTPRYFVIPSYGGFAVIYIRTVDWAAVSLFQSIYYLTALGFTVICTTITLYSLILLRVRVKSAEKSLCFTSMFISFIFLLVAATQICYIACLECRPSPYLFSAQFLAFDAFSVGSAVILVLNNSQLRDSIFSPSKNEDRVFRASTNNSFTSHVKI
ncbi:hypothetical protein L3Y34_019056 [Caenorhabditis briggsae]|nr:hypothetical protein L3Y34_019056 [Caenorhabditis briggsae]